MARTYIISEICGDWALQIREPGHPYQFLYFNSKNNADLVKSILEWEDEHPNEAVPYKPTLTPPNEPMTLEQLREMDGEPVWVKVFGPTDIRCDGWCEVEVRDKNTSDEIAYVWWAGSEVEDMGRTEDYGKTWIVYRRPPEGEEDT